MSMFKQRGGTFLGLILGLMIGLGVALGVANYVTKVPIPFINKNGARPGGPDAAEADRNRDWDPNAALRSRARPAPGGGAVASAPEPAPVLAPAEVRGAGGATPARTPASSDPLGEFAAARVAARTPAPAGKAPVSTQASPPPAGAAASDPFTYFVQAGAFRTQQEAEAQRARLSLMDVQASVSEREQAGRSIFRVRVGPFQNKDAADRVKERLDGSGFESALVRVQKGT